MRRMHLSHEPGTSDLSELVPAIREIARPLRDPSDLDPLMERIGDSRFVLLGEATHGTSEFYTWRTEISKRLIEEKGFSFIAVEGDWPDCYRVNRYVKACHDSGNSAQEVLHAFDRWPTWMWANEEIVELAEWLRELNDELPEAQRIGFYGLDVYSLWSSMAEVIQYLQEQSPDAVQRAREAYGCFDAFRGDVQEYARSTRWVPGGCEREVVSVLLELRRNAPQYLDGTREAYFDAEQNALVARNAEHYYRTMVMGGPDSWNVRDRHMMQTLERLTDFHGPRAKAIVWEHNTHIGDARFTDMAASGMVNIGQLCREARGREGVVLVGFGTHRGSVIAANAWEAPMEELPVPPGRPGSWEHALHEATGRDSLLLLEGEQAAAPLQRERGHRAIGVVYHPEWEAFGNYVPTVLPRRYDALLYVEESHAVRPLHMRAKHTREAPETYPSGV
ncbi:MAG: erythromycin esterase family protein [Armatimonadota bacterium]